MSPPHLRLVRPVYYTVADVARIIGWTPKRTRRWLERSNALVRIEGGGRYGYRLVATEESLTRAFPETAARLQSAMLENALGIDVRDIEFGLYSEPPDS